MPNLIPQEKTQLPLIPRINRYINKLTEDPSNVPKDQWKEVEIPQIGNLGAQIGASLDFIFGSDRIGLDPGEKLPYGEPSDFDMAATTMMPGPSLNRFRSITNKVKAGNKLTEAEAKLLETFRSKYGAPFELKKGEGSNPGMRFKQIGDTRGVYNKEGLIPGSKDRSRQVEMKRYNDQQMALSAAEEAKQQRLADLVERGKAKLAENESQSLKNLHPDLLKNKSEIKWEINQYLNEMEKDTRYGFNRMSDVVPDSNHADKIGNKLGVSKQQLSDMVEHYDRDAFNIARQKIAEKYGTSNFNSNQEIELAKLYKDTLSNLITDNLTEKNMVLFRSSGHGIINPRTEGDKIERIRSSLKKIHEIMEESKVKKDD